MGWRVEILRNCLGEQKLTLHSIHDGGPEEL